jgi:hypothetical protein
LLGFALAAVAWLGGCLVLAGPILYTVTIQTAAWIAPLPVVVFGAVRILPIGTYLFNLRKSHQGFYGMVELAAGVLLGSYALWNSHHKKDKFTVAQSLDLATFTAMLSGVYVVVRGLDNIDKAKKERSAVREKERAEEYNKARAQAIEVRAQVMRAVGPAYSSEE